MTVIIKNLTRERITQADLKPMLYSIYKDGAVWFDGSSILTPIVWNNITGANSESKAEHDRYCKHMGIRSGHYSIQDEKKKELASCDLIVKNDEIPLIDRFIENVDLPQ